MSTINVMHQIYKIFRKRADFITLSGILIFAFIIRVWNLSVLPHGFYTDEVVSGYVGRFILENGRDLYGNIFPLIYFDKFGDYRVIFPMYLSGLSTYIFGVNEFAVRFPPAFFGSLFVIPMYFAAYLFFKNKITAFIASLFVTILPWHVTLSRAQSEGIIGLTLFLTGLLFLFLSLSRMRKLFWVGVILLFISYFSYPTFRLLVPLALLPLPFFTKPGYMRVRFIAILLGFVAFTAFVLLTPWGKGRFEQTSLFQNRDIQEKIDAINENFAIGLGPGRVFEARLFHNKAVGYTREFVKQYFSYLSPSFLFTEGGKPFRYTIPETGLLYISFFIFIMSSFVLHKNKAENSYYHYLGYLLLVSPLPAALTFEDSPNIHRSLAMIIPLVLFASDGVVQLVTFIKAKILRMALVGFFTGVLLLEAVYVNHQYTNQTAPFKSYLRDDGLVEAAFAIQAEKKNYDELYITTHEDLAIYYLFFTKNFSSDFIGRFKKEQLRVETVENIHFVNDQCPFLRNISEIPLDKKILILAYGDCPDYPLPTIKSIMRKDSTRAFRLLTNSN